ncbi:hypothetical protein [Niabella sp.]|uniref:hypothetical protein n=1 Tax=Niabella sp. TaxID=1962976 RepID=UPI0026313D68|nr:hypothetical protein [Niabella sp.]
MKTDHLRNGDHTAYPGGFVSATYAGSITEMMRSADALIPGVNITGLNRGYITRSAAGS